MRDALGAHVNHIVRVAIDATTHSPVYIKKYDRIGRPICNYSISPLTPSEGPGTLPNRIELSSSTTGKCKQMQAVKNQDVGELRTPTNEIVHPFRWTMIYINRQILQVKIALFSKCYSIKKGGKSLIRQQQKHPTTLFQNLLIEQVLFLFFEKQVKGSFPLL